jgi:hypothetical protein
LRRPPTRAAQVRPDPGANAGQVRRLWVPHRPPLRPTSRASGRSGSGRVVRPPPPVMSRKRTWEERPMIGNECRNCGIPRGRPLERRARTVARVGRDGVVRGRESRGCQAQQRGQRGGAKTHRRRPPSPRAVGRPEAGRGPCVARDNPPPAPAFAPRRTGPRAARTVRPDQSITSPRADAEVGRPARRVSRRGMGRRFLPPPVPGAPRARAPRGAARRSRRGRRCRPPVRGA